MAKLRNSHGICPPEVLKFLLDLFKYNDNSKNNFSDNYYRAALVNLSFLVIFYAISLNHCLSGRCSWRDGDPDRLDRRRSVRLGRRLPLPRHQEHPGGAVKIPQLGEAPALLDERPVRLQRAGPRAGPHHPGRGQLRPGAGLLPDRPPGAADGAG